MDDLSATDINVICETLRRNGKKSTEIFEIMDEAWPGAVGVRRIQHICKEFREGRANFSEQHKCGRPQNPLREELKNQIREKVSEDSRLTVRELSQFFDITFIHDLYNIDRRFEPTMC